MKSQEKSSKLNIPIFLFILSGLLVVGFIVRLIADIILINTGESSAPLWLFAVVRAMEFIVPAAVLSVIAIMLQIYTKKEAAASEENIMTATAKNNEKDISTASDITEETENSEDKQ